MARKSYTEEDRARVRQALLDTGLEMAPWALREE